MRFLDPRNEIDRLMEQLRAVNTKLSELEQRVNDTTRQVTQVAAQTAISNTGVTNLLLNTDFGFSDGGYYGASWDSSFVNLAYWYRLNNTSATQIGENTTGAVSSTGNQISTSTSPTSWDKTGGTLLWSGSDAVLAPLPKNYAVPGISLYVRFAAKIQNLSPTAANPNAPLPAGTNIKVSIWENTATPRIASGTGIAGLSLVRSSGASAGAFTRDYLVVAVDSSGYLASSNIASITMADDATTVNTSQYVTVSWVGMREATQYIVYRRQNGGAFSQIALIANGATNFADYGGVSSPVTPPATNLGFPAAATTRGLRFGADFSDLAFRIRVPSTYQFISNGKQFLRLELVDASGAPTSAETAIIQVDRVLLATAPGQWTPAAQDSQAIQNVQVTTPVVITNPYDDGSYGRSRSFGDYPYDYPYGYPL
jgi:hypothetical protein